MGGGGDIYKVIERPRRQFIGTREPQLTMRKR